MKNKLSFDDYSLVGDLSDESLAKHSDWRIGQAFFNALYDLFPEIADSIRGTEFDPFYWNFIKLSTLDKILSEDAKKILKEKIS